MQRAFVSLVYALTVVNVANTHVYIVSKAFCPCQTNVNDYSLFGGTASPQGGNEREGGMDFWGQ